MLLEAIWFDDAPFLLAPLRENDKSEKLVVKASHGLEHDMMWFPRIFLFKRTTY